MSTSIAIPRRKKRVGESSNSPALAATPSSSTSAASPQSRFSYGSLGSNASASVSGTPPERKVNRRQSLMSAEFTKTEHTVVNIGDSESPRLITCVKASQGFDWNQEIFLPSYADFQFDDLERKPDPVQDIVVTDEEIANMFPS